MGDEHYYIDVISDYIADHVLDESEKSFNQTILYGKDVTPSNIIEVARRYPMMANHQVVIVKEAQVIKNLNELEVYLNAPQKSTVLVICLKTSSGAKPTKLTQAVKKFINQAKRVGIVFESNQLYDNQIPDWIVSYLAPKGKAISPTAAEMLREFLGVDLSKIANELNKLVITLPPDVKQITPEHIERNIGISKDFNRFEFVKAIGQRDVVRVNRIVDHFAKNSSANPIVLSIISIFQYFQRIFKFHFLKDKSDRNAAVTLGVNPYFLSEYKSAARVYPPRKCVEIFTLLRQYDMRSKGVNNENTDQGELLRELVFKIMH